jgi:type IV pilus secretin PilQ/predicted competence protein
MSARVRTALALLGLIALGAGIPLSAQTPAAPSPTDPGSRALVDASLARTPSGGALLSLTADGALPYEAFALDNPPRIVLDLLGAQQPIPVHLSDRGGFVQKIRYAPRRGFRGGSNVRYVLETQAPAAYRVATIGAELNLLVEPGTAAMPAAPVRSAAPAAPVAQAAPVAPVEPAAQAALATPVVPAMPVMPATPVAAAAPVAPVIPIAPAAPVAPVKTATAAPPPAPAAPAAAVETAESAPAPAPAGALLAQLPPLEPQPIAPVADPPEDPAPDPRPMSLDVQGADVRTVFRSIAQYAGINIIADSNVDATVTIRALDLPWPEMLDAVCRSSGLIVLSDNPVIRVANQHTAQDEAVAVEANARKQEELLALETRIVPVHYANGAELQETLGKIVSSRGQVQVDPRTNSLILTDIGPRLDQLEEMVKRLDSETVQVEIAAKIVDVDATVARQLGISWGGTDLHSSDARASGSVSLQPGDLLDPAGDVRIGFLRSFGQIEARLQALEDERKAEIVSTPRITTVDNRMARILVGKQVPLITQDFAGNAITELKKVGMALEVTPHINGNNEITMDLHPEISDLASESATAGGIIFTTTEADTRVMVQDGETAVIGGLIRDGKLISERGVPLLKDIPLIGRLFRTSDRRVEKRELLIFVTPRIVRGVGSRGKSGPELRSQVVE